ncbi:MAG: DUF2911 domain-containing protein [Bacteroidia bacterium]|jgi:hypothetical protein|nr:DUF2911 domain-containing protein [Bacteroidia bacterium]
MIKKVLTIVAIILVLLIGVFTYLRSATKKHSPSASAFYHENGYVIDVNYCRPFKKGRVIFGPQQTGALQEYGKYWRAGANEATVFTTQHDLMVNGSLLPAGKYALYAIPDENNWTIAFNHEHDRWGAISPDESNDALRVTVPADNTANTQEQFIISFEQHATGVNMILHWDNTKVIVPLLKK